MYITREDISFLVGSLLFVFLVLVLPAHLALSGAFEYQTRTNGEHVGFITAVEQDTWRFLSYTAETYTVYVKTSLESSQEDAYCVLTDNSELIDDLREAARDRSNIVITYDSYTFVRASRCEDQATSVSRISD